MQSLKEMMDQTYQNTIDDIRELREDEYLGKDNIIYCSKCNTRKQTEEVIPLFNKRMPVPCQCEKDKQKEFEERIRRQEKQRRIERLKCRSLMEERYKNANFDDLDLKEESFRKAFTRCKKYCEISHEALEKGYGIYLWGNSGLGKTQLTACMANELLNKEYTVLFTNFFEILKAIRNTFNNKTTETDDSIMNDIADVDFLFIDDLGTESLAKNSGDNFTQDKIFEIINKRYNKKKPTIFSSNYHIKELVVDRNFMDKTVDRINEMSTAVIEIKGNSYRTKKVNDEVVPF